jgi:hypothetical protein
MHTIMRKIVLFCFVIPGLTFYPCYNHFCNPDTMHGEVPYMHFPDTDSSDNFINGWLYRMQTTRLGHPFFKSEDWQSGKLSTESGEYSGIMLKYDLFQDALIIKVLRNGSLNPVVLNPFMIKEFTIDNHQFINLNKASGSCDEIYPGYFEQIYKGKLIFLYKWKKSIIDEKVRNGSNFEIIKEKYLFWQGHLYMLKGNASLYRIFPDKKRAIKEFLGKNGISIRRSGDGSLNQLFEFCDHLLINP